MVGVQQSHETENCKGLVNVNMLRPAVPAGWLVLKLGVYSPTETGRERSSPS